AYFEQVRPELMCTPAAASAMGYLLRYLLPGTSLPNDPQLPDPGSEPEDGGLWEDVARAAVASLPGWAIELYGDVLPGVGEPPGRAEVRAVLGVMDAAFLSEPGVLEARQRIQARIRQTLRLRSALSLSGAEGRVDISCANLVALQVQRVRDLNVLGAT